MPPELFAFLFAAGAFAGFLSGLMGIGGGILMFPALYFGPPALGLEAIDVKSITGLTMTQGFFASFSAVLLYRAERLVSRPLVVTLGGSLFLSSLVGSALSKAVPDRPLLLIFGALAVAAALLMLIPRSHHGDDARADQIRFSRPLAAGLGLVLGFFLGMVGQGGAFLIIPVMLYILRIPLRVAMGSMLAVGLFSALAGLAGKAATAQVPYPMAAAMLAGAVPMAQVGGRLSRRTQARHLRWLLAVVIIGASLKIWAGIL